MHSSVNGAVFVDGFGWYKYVNTKMNWESAENVCRKMGAKLVATETKMEVDALKGKRQMSKRHHIDIMCVLRTSDRRT